MDTKRTYYSHSGHSAVAPADAVNSCPQPVHFPDVIFPSL
jgi:hypothetical protein